MKTILFLIVASSALLSIEVAPYPTTQRKNRQRPDVIQAGYWPSWGTLSPSQIDTSDLTYIYYSFLLLNDATYQLNVTPQDDKLLKTFTSALNGKAAALISIGGGSSNSTTFSIMASNSTHRKTFIKSTIQIARRYQIDGYDLDWEFPRDNIDMNNFGLLLREWREALTKEAKRRRRCHYILSAAVYYASHVIFQNNQAYPGAAIRKYLDWINVMFYEYHGSSDTNTGSPTAVFDNTSNVSTSIGLGSWIQNGVPAQKITMGLALYGHSWKLRNASQHGLGSPVVGVGTGSGDGEHGTMTFSQINHFIRSTEATVVYDNTTVSTYAYKNTTWVGYDDAVSIIEKIKYAKGQKLLGHFFWALGYDGWVLTKEASRAWKL